ncbi:MAG: hypothetical protein H7647_00555, partial [Candidatus Heimdallarchaeota archaeon]|nr:hypothetical protein [Candidatus Heimdallarchaeota archaeon]MCK4252924.1 hypothetical protein [Candidatus Heimdallarchaeota archaeon]
MSNELIGKVPFWMVKFALNNVIRKKMMQNNEVVLPEDESKWKKMGKLSSSKVRKFDFQAALGDGEFHIKSIDNGVLNIRISKQLSNIPQTDAVIL